VAGGRWQVTNDRVAGDRWQGGRWQVTNGRVAGGWQQVAGGR